MATFKHCENKLHPSEFCSLICNCNDSKQSKAKRAAMFLDPKFNGVQFKTATFNRSMYGYFDSASSCSNGFYLEMGEDIKNTDKNEDFLLIESNVKQVLHSL